MDPDLEAAQQALAPAPGGKVRTGVLEMPITDQKSFSTKSALRSLLALERVLRAGGVTPNRESAPALRRSQSQTSLRPMAWES